MKTYLKNNFPGLVRLVRRIKSPWSETSKCRKSLAPFCSGDGIDIGYGGDPIVRNAICMDMPCPYAQYRSHPQHLHGDARDIHWFRDGLLDFVYSSHVLEDFEDTATVLNEWLRLLKRGGHLVLFLPDEQTYRTHCKKTGQFQNPHHIHENFGLEYLKKCFAAREDIKIVHERFPVGIYSFELVLKKL